VCISEAWTLPPEARKAHVEKTDGYENISDHPDRYDILMVSVEALTGDWMAEVRLVGEGADRTLPDTIEFRSLHSAMSSGRFTDLLPNKPSAGLPH
jgi:hypothetical protein